MANIVDLGFTVLEPDEGFEFRPSGRFLFPDTLGMSHRMKREGCQGHHQLQSPFRTEDSCIEDQDVQTRKSFPFSSES